MKYCSKCGNELMDEAVFCPKCGCAQGTVQQVSSTTVKTDSSSFGWGLLGFCIPLVGLILFLVWKDDTPLKAKSAGLGALISVIAAVIIYIIYFIILAFAYSYF